MDTQIDRSDGDFRKNESPDESRELEREEYRDSDELAELPHGGGPVNMEAQPIIKAAKIKKKESHAVGSWVGFKR